MRILLVADIHANRAAIEAIREPFDACFCLGDLIEYGPEPVACLDWVRRNATATVRGNHDHGCVQDVEVSGVGGFRYLTMATRRPTRAMLSQTDLRYLADLPLTQMLTLGGHQFLLVHATPRDPLDEYTPADAEVWKAKLAGIRADFVCVGHTHQQFVLKAGKATVVNPGSAGLPRDGDPRVRYAIIEDGKVELKQMEYDVDDTLTALNNCTFPEKARAMLTGVYRSGRTLNGRPKPELRAETYTM